MEKIVQIHGITATELYEYLEKVTQKSDGQTSALDLSKIRVDRGFLMLNFSWTRYAIVQYEKNGKLKRIFTGNAKSHYYTLDQCIALRKEELSLINN